MTISYDLRSLLFSDAGLRSEDPKGGCEEDNETKGEKGCQEGGTQIHRIGNEW